MEYLQKKENKKNNNKITDNNDKKLVYREQLFNIFNSCRKAECFSLVARQRTLLDIINTNPALIFHYILLEKSSDECNFYKKSIIQFGNTTRPSSDQIRTMMSTMYDTTKFVELHDLIELNGAMYNV